MEELYKLKDLLCDELEEYGRKGELSAGSLEIIDKLSHALKSITTVIAMKEADDDYSNMYPYDGSYRPMNRGNSYRRSYARNQKRDSMGRYSRRGYSREDGYSGAVDDMVDKLHELMVDAPNEEIKSEIKRLVSKVENM